MKKTNNNPSEIKKTVRSKAKRRKIISCFTIVLIVWLLVITIGVCYFYSKANSYLTHYEEAYQLSLPDLVAEDVFAHFKNYDVDYIWDNMTETPRISRFESEAYLKNYISDMINGKEMTYQPSSKYSDAVPTYVVEADGFVVAEFTLCKDLSNPGEFGFPTWQLNSINYYTESFETVFISAPSNFGVYVNGALLDDSYIISEEDKPSDESYLLDYGTMPSIVNYYVADLYQEPSVVIKDMFDQEVEVTYDEQRDFYFTGYTSEHIEREAIEEFSYNYTITFANVISRDEQLQNLLPYFPENSQLYDSISRNTALQYFMYHSSTTIENQEIRDFVAYSEDVIYVEVYIEQHMTVGYNDIQVVPTTARLYLVRIDGEWKVISMRF